MAYTTAYVINNLTEIDFDVLIKIYKFRCLSVNQIYNEMFKESYTDANTFNRTKVAVWNRYELIKRIKLSKTGEVVLFLTAFGIKVVREYENLPSEIFDIQTGKVVKGYRQAASLQMDEKAVPHQLLLNNFVLKFEERVSEMKNPYSYRYFDEKHMGQYNTIRPDGMLQLFNTDFFLEMDMNTETIAQLNGKWKHYLNFLKSEEFSQNSRNIVVLFIVGNTNLPENRKLVIQKTITDQIIGDLRDNFNIFLGTEDDLLDLMFNHLLLQGNVLNPNIYNNYKLMSDEGYTVSTSTSLQKQLQNVNNGLNYDWYIRKRDNKNNILFMPNSTSSFDEFFVLDYSSGSMNLFTSILYHPFVENQFYFNFNRNIKLLVIVPDYDKFLIIMKLLLLDNSHTNNLFIISEEDLAKKDITKYAKQIDIETETYKY